MPPEVFLGCTGWGYDEWTGPFYPAGTPAGERLRRYARVFRLVEVDSSYYRAPTREQAARWAVQTPDGFLFTLKFPGDVTHKASLRDADDLVDAFLAALAPLRVAGKLGPLVLQLPASFRRDRDEAALHAFLAAWPRGQRLAVELRDASWWVPATYRALREAGAALVWSVTDAGRTPDVVTGDFLYLRFVGDRALARFGEVQRDASAEMARWRERFEEHAAQVDRAYVLLNNHLEGHAPASARRLAHLWRLPLPDLAAARRLPGQASLADGF